MECLGIYLMLVFAVLLVANGVRLLVFCGYSRSFVQVMVVACAVLVVFGAPLLLVSLGAIPRIVELVFSAIGMVVFALFLAFSAMTLWLGKRTIGDKWDYVMVLGAGLRHGTVPSLTLSSRLDRAIEMLGRNPVGKVVVCGGQGSDESVPESYAMRAYLEEHGVNPARIIEDSKSTTTYENLLFGMRRVYENAAEANSTLSTSFGRGTRDPSFPDASHGEAWVYRIEDLRCLLNELESPFGAKRVLDVFDMNERYSSLPRVVVITSDFHALRACLLSMMVPAAAFVGFVGKPSRLYYLPLGLARDYVSLLVHIVRLALGKER